MIPAENEKRLTLDLESFSKSVERVLTVAAEKTRGIKISEMAVYKWIRATALAVN